MKSFQHIVYFILQKVGSWILLAIWFFLVLWVTFAAVEWPSSGPDGEIEGGIFAWLMKKVLENEDVSDSTNSGTVKYARNSDMVDGLHANELMAWTLWEGWLENKRETFLQTVPDSIDCWNNMIEIEADTLIAPPPYSNPTDYDKYLYCAVTLSDARLFCGITYKAWASNPSFGWAFRWKFNVDLGKKLCVSKNIPIIVVTTSNRNCPTEWSSFSGSDNTFMVSKFWYSEVIGTYTNLSDYDTSPEIRSNLDNYSSYINMGGWKVCKYTP